MSSNEFVENIRRQMADGEQVEHQTLVDSTMGLLFACIITGQAVYWHPAGSFSRYAQRLPHSEIAGVGLLPQPKLSLPTVLSVFALLGGLMAWWLKSSMQIPLGAALGLVAVFIVAGLVIALVGGRSSADIQVLRVTTRGGKKYAFNPYEASKRFSAELRAECVAAQHAAYRAMLAKGILPARP